MCFLSVGMLVPRHSCRGQRTTSSFPLFKTGSLLLFAAVRVGLVGLWASADSFLFCFHLARSAQGLHLCYWPWLFMGSQDSNSGLHAYTINTLPTLPSLTHKFFHFTLISGVSEVHVCLAHIIAGLCHTGQCFSSWLTRRKTLTKCSWRLYIFRDPLLMTHL